MPQRASCGASHHSGKSAVWLRASFPCRTRMPINAFKTDLVIDHPKNMADEL